MKKAFKFKGMYLALSLLALPASNARATVCDVPEDVKKMQSRLELIDEELNSCNSDQTKCDELKIIRRQLIDSLVEKREKTRYEFSLKIEELEELLRGSEANTDEANFLQNKIKVLKDYSCLY